MYRSLIVAYATSSDSIARWDFISKTLCCLEWDKDILINKLNKIKQACANQSLNLNKEKTAIKNCVDIKLVGEDYTIGKVIEYILHYDYYLQEQVLSYVGFIKFHPHDDYSVIRMAYSDDNQFTNQNIYNMISYVCDSGINIFINLKEHFG